MTALAKKRDRLPRWRKVPFVLRWAQRGLFSAEHFAGGGALIEVEKEHAGLQTSVRMIRTNPSADFHGERRRRCTH